MQTDLDLFVLNYLPVRRTSCKYPSSFRSKWTHGVLLWYFHKHARSLRDRPNSALLHQCKLRITPEKPAKLLWICTRGNESRTWPRARMHVSIRFQLVTLCHVLDMPAAIYCGWKLPYTSDSLLLLFHMACMLTPCHVLCVCTNSLLSP